MIWRTNVGVFLQASNLKTVYVSPHVVVGVQNNFKLVKLCYISSYEKIVNKQVYFCHKIKRKLLQ